MGKPAAIVAELGQYLGAGELAQPWKAGDDPVVGVAVDLGDGGLGQVVGGLAGRLQVREQLAAEAATHATAIRRLVRAWRPDLLTQRGVGPITAATVLCAWSHPGRIHSEAAFAMLGGAAPIPASSGQTQRHRRNRSGDRQLNRALHTIALVRLRHDPATRAYAQRRRAQGKTDREIKRCLVRYIARQLYRLLEAPVDET